MQSVKKGYHYMPGRNNLPTYSTEQSTSWEGNRFSVSQEIPRIVGNPKVHYRSHKCPPSVPILSQVDQSIPPTSYFLEIHFNIILPSAPGSPKWSLSLRFPHQNPVSYASLTYVLHAPPISRCNHPNNIGWEVVQDFTIPGYYKRNRHFQCCIETKLLMI